MLVMRFSRRKPSGLAANGKGGSLTAQLFAPNRLIPDVSPAEAARPADPVDRRIGARLSLGDRLAGCRHAQHTPAIGGDAAAFNPRAGMENLHALDRARRIEPLDQRALAVTARIALGRHHDHQGGPAIPAHIAILALPI